MTIVFDSSRNTATIVLTTEEVILISRTFPVEEALRAHFETLIRQLRAHFVDTNRALVRDAITKANDATIESVRQFLKLP